MSTLNNKLQQSNCTQQKQPSAVEQQPAAAHRAASSNTQKLQASSSTQKLQAEAAAARSLLGFNWESREVEKPEKESRRRLREFGDSNELVTVKSEALNLN